jgi:hypothetical protein
LVLVFPSAVARMNAHPEFRIMTTNFVTFPERNESISETIGRYRPDYAIISAGFIKGLMPGQDALLMEVRKRSQFLDIEIVAAKDLRQKDFELYFENTDTLEVRRMIYQSAHFE